jgi:hypothetical protein
MTCDRELPIAMPHLKIYGFQADLSTAMMVSTCKTEFLQCVIGMEFILLICKAGTLKSDNVKAKESI